MALQSFLAKKWVHTILVIIPVVMIIGPAITEVFPAIDPRILALGPILTWSLGVTYQRNLLLEAEIVDRDELREAENQASFWGG